MIDTEQHPIQLLALDNHGVLRFKANAIVRYLLDHNGEGRKIDMNALARMDFTDEDRQQFAQLIGYSLCGYHELNYVSDEAALAASAKARETIPDAKGCRDDGCPIHCGMPGDGEECEEGEADDGE